MSARLNICLIQDHNSGLRTWLEKWRIQWGLWDSTMREFSGKMEINITRFFGRRLSRRATRLATLFIRTSYTISQGSITLREFSARKGEKIPCFCL